MLATIATSALAACDGKELDGGTRHAFFVRGALAPPNDRPNGTCVYSNDPNAAQLFEGRVDFGVADTFQLVMAVQGSDPAVATSITGAHVVVRDGDAELRSFDVVTTGYIEPGARGLVSFTAMDPPTRELLLPMLPNRQASKSVTIEVELTGRDPAGGPDVTTPVFKFPVLACNGCLVDFSESNDETMQVQPNCFKPAPAGTRVPCFSGQDEIVSCASCVARRPVCDPNTP
ncbi:MAG: hypothetical protein JWP87_3291 [Labilithrix sp.]|nr:hypothetical protein [Labilithrix sp.]